MKKLLIISAVLLITMASCIEPQKTKPVNYSDGSVVYERRFTGKDGHKYIEFRRHMTDVAYLGEDNYTGFEHDPECLKKDMEEVLRKVLNEQKTGKK